MTERLRPAAKSSEARFHDLLAKKRALRIGLSVITLMLFFGFVLLTSTPLGTVFAQDRVGTVPLEMVFAIGIIAFVVLATGFYVFWSNSRIDPAVEALRQEMAP